ncbi:hypothetical protein D3C84_909670 [compost metagenome]
MDHGGKIAIESHLITLLAQQFIQTAGNVQFVGKQNRAWVGRPPEDWLPLREPGKAAVTIGLDQPIGGQVATGSQQPVGVAHGFFQRRESQGVAL